MKRTSQLFGIIALAAVIGFMAACRQPSSPNPGTTTYTVTFDKNHEDADGYTEASPHTKTVTEPATLIDALPEQPTREGYTFIEWNVNADGTGEEFTEATPVTADITVYAQWEIISGSFIVTFDRNHDDTDGYTEANPQTKIVSPPETTIRALPEPPVRAGHTFIGWTAPDGELFTEEYEVIESITVTANWLPDMEPSSLTLYKNGAEVAGVDNMITLTAWLLIPNNIESGADYRAVLHQDAVIPSTLILAGSASNVTLTLEGDGNPRTIKMGAKGWLEIRSGVTVILGDGITLRGRNFDEDGEDNDVFMIYVRGGTLEMRPGSEISGNVNRVIPEDGYGNGTGSAVVVLSGTFNMKGGVIRDNSIVVEPGFNARGAGVVVSTGTFTMEGDAFVDPGNEVSIGYYVTIRLNGTLSQTQAAYLRPSVYADGHAVLSGDTAENYEKFELAPYSTPCSIDSEGKLVFPRYSVNGTVSLTGGSGSLNHVTVELLHNGTTLIPRRTMRANAAGAYNFDNVIYDTGYSVQASLSGYYLAVTDSFDVTSDAAVPDLSLSPGNVWIDIEGGTQDTPYDSLATAISWLNANAQSNTNYTIRLGGNDTLASAYLNCVDKTNVGVTIKPNSGTATIQSTDGCVIIIFNGVSLTLENGVTLRGLNTIHGDSLVYVSSGGKLIMKDGSLLTGNTYPGGNNIYGGGVYVAPFRVDHDVYLPPGIFEMDGGTISGNTASDAGGGVCVSSNGTFTKTGGTIYGTDGEANANKAGASTWGNAVYVFSSPAKRRETTAGTGVNMDSTVAGAAGGWE